MAESAPRHSDDDDGQFQEIKSKIQISKLYMCKYSDLVCVNCTTLYHIYIQCVFFFFGCEVTLPQWRSFNGHYLFKPVQSHNVLNRLHTGSFY